MKRENLEKARRTIENIKAVEEEINLLTDMGSENPHPELELVLKRDRISRTIVIKDRAVLAPIVKDRLIELKAELAHLEAILEDL